MVIFSLKEAALGLTMLREGVRTSHKGAWDQNLSSHRQNIKLGTGPSGAGSSGLSSLLTSTLLLPHSVLIDQYSPMQGGCKEKQESTVKAQGGGHGSWQ